jgi:undecaprenyl diphosphate synthase
MDGNGRWAEQRGKERFYGHSEGVESVRACTAAAEKEGVKYLSLFAFSEENWNRPENEVSSLMELMLDSLQQECRDLCKNGVRLLILGNRSRLSDRLNSVIDNVVAKTSGNTGITLIIFMSYSGKWDILQAAKKFAEDYAGGLGSELSQMETGGFDKYLVTSGIPDPDLIIRTSGEERMSNYLLWQGAYSELLFVDTLWPDFREAEFHKALVEYSKRDRRYGNHK